MVKWFIACCLPGVSVGWVVLAPGGLALVGLGECSLGGGLRAG